MMVLRFLPILVVLMACQKQPETYEDCLLDFGRSHTAEETLDLCQAAFPVAAVYEAMSEADLRVALQAFDSVLATGQTTDMEETRKRRDMVMRALQRKIGR